jgi:hypothetical protein
MIKKISGTVLLLHPILIPVMLFNSQLEFFWYWSENYRLYDLIYASISLMGFLAGIVLVRNKPKVSIFILVTYFFIMYQLVADSFKINRFVDTIELPADRAITLVQNDGGAFTTSSQTNLLLWTPKYGLFQQSTFVKAYPDAGFGKLRLDDQNQIHVELQSYDTQQAFSERFLLNDLIKL